MHKADFRLIVHGLDSEKSSLLLQTLSDGGFIQPIVVDDFAQAMVRAASSSLEDPKTTIAVIDGGVIININAVEECTRAVMDAAVGELSWLSLVSDGIDFSGGVVDNGNYLDHAVTPVVRPAAGVHDGAPSLLLIRPEALTHILSERFKGVAQPALGELFKAGWEAGLPSYHSSHLRFSVNGQRAAEHKRKGTPRPSKWRPPDLADCRPEPTVTIGIRTTLTRPYLLRRTVASAAVAAARRDVEKVVIVGSVDPLALEEACAELRESFPGLRIEPHATSPSGHSRTANLLAAIDSATTDYIWFVDDDDMATPHSIAAIKDAVISADRPLLFGISEAYSETWADDTRPLLMWSQKIETYDPVNVLNAFTGTNSLPICSMVIPVELAQTRLRGDLLRHDLGEDYALLLLLLTAPGARFGYIDTDIAHISIRQSSDSVVTYRDRTPWLQNLSGFMADLSTDPLASNQAVWELGEGLRHPAVADGETQQLRDQVNDLIHQRSELERALANMRDWASAIETRPSPAPTIGATGSKLKRLVPRRFRPLALRVYNKLSR